MWQSFAAIGRGTSEIRLPKEKKHHGQNISPSGTAVPGGLMNKPLFSALLSASIEIYSDIARFPRDSTA